MGAPFPLSLCCRSGREEPPRVNSSPLSSRQMGVKKEPPLLFCSSIHLLFSFGGEGALDWDSPPQEKRKEDYFFSPFLASSANALSSDLVALGRRQPCKRDSLPQKE